MKRDSPTQCDLRDELARICREIENLKKTVASMRRELVFREETVGELPMMPRESYPVETPLERAEKDCNMQTRWFWNLSTAAILVYTSLLANFRDPS